jgi:hypothetical protein
MACLDMEYMGARGIPKKEAVWSEGEEVSSASRIRRSFGAHSDANIKSSHMEPSSTILFSPVLGFFLRW